MLEYIQCIEQCKSINKINGIKMYDSFNPTILNSIIITTPVSRHPLQSPKISHIFVKQTTLTSLRHPQ